MLDFGARNGSKDFCTKRLPLISGGTSIPLGCP